MLMLIHLRVTKYCQVTHETMEQHLAVAIAIILTNRVLNNHNTVQSLHDKKSTNDIKHELQQIDRDFSIMVFVFDNTETRF